MKDEGCIANRRTWERRALLQQWKMFAAGGPETKAALNLHQQWGPSNSPKGHSLSSQKFQHRRHQWLSRVGDSEAAVWKPYPERSSHLWPRMVKTSIKTMTKAMAKKALKPKKAKKATALYRIAMCQRFVQRSAKCIVQKVCRALYCSCKNIQNRFPFGTMPCQRHVHGQSLLAVAMTFWPTRSQEAWLKLQPELSDYVTMYNNYSPQNSHQHRKSLCDEWKVSYALARCFSWTMERYGPFIVI